MAFETPKLSPRELATGFTDTKPYISETSVYRLLKAHDVIASPAFIVIKAETSGGGKDVFVHISALERAGLSNLSEGQAIEYEEVSNRGKTSAENLKVQR